MPLTWHIAISAEPLEDRKIAEPETSKRVSWSLFVAFVAMAISFGTVLQLSGFLERQELQTINRRFEARQWLRWSKEGLQRLQPSRLWAYHEQHEQPKAWYAWDFTLSWLIEPNHPPLKNKIVIFNHSVEDEPPAEAVAHFPWMQPLLNYPIRRQSVAQMVELLAKAGAKAIVLDNDFPQYTADDVYLAKAMHNASSGKFGKPVPVFMVRALNKFSTPEMMTYVAPTAPVGVLEDLRKLEPGEDVVSKYTGMTCVNQDADQVVRRANIRIVSNPISGEKQDAVILKVLKALDKPIPGNLPDTMDIDFIAFPHSDLIPVRPLSYLFDPQQQARLLSGKANGDVTVKDAIVFIGDEITDVYSTPFTNEGENQMSGTEILANALDTISRASWPKRLEGAGAIFYLLLASLAGGAAWCLWKSIQQKVDNKLKNKAPRLNGSMFRLTTDTLFFCVLLMGSYFVACLAFAYTGMMVPVFVPSIALGIGALAAIVWEREREREQAFLLQLEAQTEKHQLELDKVESELARQEVEAENREMYQDRKRRHEFVRRINHDLNAPVSVLNWTIAELQMMDLQNQQAHDKVSRLVKSSDKLCELIDQLVQSYDYEITPGLANNQAALCNLTEVLNDCVDGQQPLAEKYEDKLEWTKPEQALWVKANSLELSRVVDNIIRNAIKHNPHKTSVFVTIDSNGAFHKIHISDSGKGIAPEHLKRIFEPGYRINPERKDGHGLGLDIAKTLIEGMGGEISVSSTVGIGTTFQLKLPICSEARAMHTDFIADEEIQETLEDSPALNARRKTLEIAKQGDRS
ncbi:MAG: CHASE2 domain-containing protein [Candidatus Obscuribacterales bacterium]|nr:CHASE2 domain-containing protein [Candidatus Obscuribacterales bacterium]